MAEEEEGAEVLVYAQNGTVWEAYIIWVRGARRQLRPGIVIGVKHAHAILRDASISWVADLRSKLLRAFMLRSPSIPIEANHYIEYFILFSLSSSI